MGLRDEIFKKNIFKNKPFEFNQKVAEVFEDTLNRSIPNYNETIRMSGELIHHSLVRQIEESEESKKFKIYDLGCSTGYFLKKIIIHLVLAKEFSHILFKFTGVDNSKSMLKKAGKNCQNLINQGIVDFQEVDLEKFEFSEQDLIGAVTLNYTLQFLKEDSKVRLLKNIYNQLNPGGVLVLSEKIKLADQDLNDKFNDFYHNFKRRNHYSEEEIARKQEALIDIFHLSRQEELYSLLRLAGFQRVEITQKWYNFCSFLAVK